MAKTMTDVLAPGEEARPYPRSPKYMVTSHARVFSLARARRGPLLLKMVDRGSGYRAVSVGAPVSGWVPLHRMVAETFLPDPESPEHILVLHNDGDASNSRPENLRWGTAAENQADCIRHGNRPRGEDVSHAVLLNAQVVEMRELCAAGARLVDLAARYDVDQSQVYRIVTGRTWKSVAGPLHVPRPTASITAEIARSIREEYALGGGQGPLAEKYGTSRANISCVVLGKSWPDAGGPIAKRRKVRRVAAAG